MYYNLFSHTGSRSYVNLGYEITFGPKFRENRINLAASQFAHYEHDAAGSNFILLRLEVEEVLILWHMSSMPDLCDSENVNIGDAHIVDNFKKFIIFSESSDIVSGNF